MSNPRIDATCRICNHPVEGTADLVADSAGVYHDLCFKHPELWTDGFEVSRQIGRRVKDGGQWGTLVRCPNCHGSGTLHDPDEKPRPVSPQSSDPPPRCAAKLYVDLPDRPGHRAEAVVLQCVHPVGHGGAHRTLETTHVWVGDWS